MKHGIASLDVRQESIAQTFSCWGTFDETRNISHIEKGRHFAENKKTNPQYIYNILTKHYSIVKNSNADLISWKLKVENRLIINNGPD